MEVDPRGRLCYATLRYESEVGGKFRRCTRCLTAWYSSRDAQRAHWKLHKSVCQPPDETAGSAMHFRELFLRVKASVKRGGDANLAVLLRRLTYAWADEDEDDDDAMEEAEMQLHTLARGIIFGGPQLPLKLWSCPGMPEFALSGFDLLQPDERLKAKHFPLGLPGVLAIKNQLQGEELTIANKIMEMEETHCWGERNSAYEMCYFFFGLLVGSAIQGRSSFTSIHDGVGELREGPVAEAATRRVLELWLHPGVRRSCGDALAPGPSFAVTAIRSYIMAGRDPGAPDLLAPGLAKDTNSFILCDLDKN